MEEAVIISAVRTPIGRFGGGLSEVSAVDLGAVVIEEAVRRAGVTPEQVDEVIMGQRADGGPGDESGASEPCEGPGCPFRFRL